MSKKVSKFKAVKLNNNQMYFMRLETDTRIYFAYGTNLRKMAENILTRYNQFCDDEDRFESLEEFAKQNRESGWYYTFDVYIVESNEALDIDCYNENYLGNYLESIL